jgi:hypothetical protein
MSNPFGNFISSILDFLRSLFGLKTGGTDTLPQPGTMADNITEPVHSVAMRVLLIIYDPIMDAAGTKLSQYKNWFRVDDLVNGFIADIQLASGGMARYQIVQRQEVNEFPAKTDGYRYNPETFLAVLHGASPHMPQEADYHAILTGFSILPRIAAREIDEVWLFGFPHAGFYESVMAGVGSFWCNANPLADTSGCKRKFVIMGFSYERGVGEMLESFGHRAESLLAAEFHSLDFLRYTYHSQGASPVAGADLNPFQQFLCFDKIAPGKAAIGNIHYPPNGEQDYDWNNPRLVPSNCYDWYNFPKFMDDIRQVDASEWGSGDIRKHHVWWLKHLPKAAGRTGGAANNWWQYVMDPNLVGM